VAADSDVSRQTLGTTVGLSDAAVGDVRHQQGSDLSGAVLLDRFKLIRLVGRGGMGAVYEARDLLLDATVALKLLAKVDGREHTTLEQLRREVLLARRVTHVHVARLFDCYEAPEGLFLTMEFLEGETLAQRTSRPPPLTLPERLEVLRQICSGVEAIHAQGIVHRDLKPSNVFLTRSGSGFRAAVTDFGIAHADPHPDLAERLSTTGTGVVVGTPRYMAPEQLRGDPVTARVDIFALAVVATELLEGFGPTRSALARTLERARADDPLRRPERPGDLLSSIELALRKPWFRRRAGLLAGAVASLFVAIVASSAWRAHAPVGSLSSDQALATAKGQKLYAQGLERLRTLDHVGARDLLEGAVTAEPGSPTARGALARAWWNLGYSSKAKVLAREAFEASATAPPIQRTRLEALYRKLSGDSPKAEDLFQSAFTASRSVEDALDLASVQPAAKAFEMLTAFRKTLHPVDQRVDLALSDAAWRSGRFDEARTSAVAVETVAREQHLPFLLAGALRAQARVIYEIDAPRPEAFAKLDAASAILKEAGDLGAVADIECEKALESVFFGTVEQSEQGRRHLESGISLFRRLGNSERAYWWLSAIGLQLLSFGRLTEVQSLMREARDEIDPTGESPDPSFWTVTAWTAIYTGDLQTARRDLARFRSGTAGTEVMPRPSGILVEAELLREEDHLVEAHALLETWLAKAQSTGARTAITDFPMRLARLDSDLGHPDQCLERLSVHERAGHDLGPLFIRSQGPIQAVCSLQKGDVAGARKVAERGLAAATASGFFTWRIFNGLALARADAAERKFPEAEKRIQALITEAREHGHVLALFESRLALGEVGVLARSPAASATLKALEDEASEKGYLRIARLAHEARGTAVH
jgi:tetratricopeptide (TPR) repeat protein